MSLISLFPDQILIDSCRNSSLTTDDKKSLCIEAIVANKLGVVQFFVEEMESTLIIDDPNLISQMIQNKQMKMLYLMRDNISSKNNLHESNKSFAHILSDKNLIKYIKHNIQDLRHEDKNICYLEVILANKINVVTFFIDELSFHSVIDDPNIIEKMMIHRQTEMFSYLLRKKKIDLSKNNYNLLQTRN